MKQKNIIISHVACKYTCVKNTVSLVLSLYYSCHVYPNANDLAQLDKLRCVFLKLPDSRPGQQGMATNVMMATNVEYNDDIYIDDIRSGLLLSVSDED